jgi:predicted CXXCH cytochrome family protein
VKIVCLAIFFSLLFNVTAHGSQTGENIVTVHYPAESISREYDLMGMSVSVPEGSVDQIKVSVNEEEQVVIASENKFICFSVNLEPGINTIEIVALKEGSVVECITRSVFRRSDLSAVYKKVPAEYGEKDYFHMKDNPECAGCHVLNPTAFDEKPVSPATFDAGKYDMETIITSTSTCYSCHKSINSYPYVHGPSSVWSCLSCHDPESSPRYSVEKPDTEMCYRCHVEQKDGWLAKKVIHGPVTLGKCTICHSPHSSTYPFNLFKPVWDLCTNCHFEKGTGVHVFADSMFKEGHPTKDRKDPIRDGKELTCASCHDPHASNNLHLWAFNVENLYDLCQKCHMK